MISTRRGRLATAVVTFVAALGLVAASAPTTAHAASTGSISGVIFDSHGPISGAVVYAHTTSSADPDITVTANDGSYTFANLAANTYRVCASGQPIHQYHCYGGEDYFTATPLSVTTGEVGNINIALTRYATITGTIRLPNGSAAAGATVTAWPIGESGAPTTTTDASGGFTMLVLPNTYVVRAEVSGSYPMTFFTNTGSTTQRAQASSFTLTEDGTKSLTITLQAGTTVSGKVTAQGAKPSSDVAPIAWQKRGDDWYSVGQASYDATTGRYSKLLGAGTYVLAFNINGSPHLYGEVPLVITAGQANRSIDIDCLPLYDTTAVPTITGTATYGSTLTAVAGSWSPVPTSFTYQWLRNGNEIAGATKATYVVGLADVGTQLAVVVTAIKTGYFHDYYQSKPTTTVPTPPKVTAGKPRVIGSPKVGKTLSLRKGTWVPTKLTFTYQWYRGSTAIKGATKSTYKLTKADKGKKLRVRLIATRPGYLSAKAYTPLTSTIR